GGPETAEGDGGQTRDGEHHDDRGHQAAVRRRPAHGLAGERLELVRLAKSLAADLDPLGVLRHAPELALPYILYLKSSGDIFSRISAHLSREVLERSWSFPSSLCCNTLEASRAFFATHSGLLVGSARLIASEGRASMVTSRPFRRR